MKRSNGARGSRSGTLEISARNLAGAERKPTGKAKGLPHRARPWHDKNQPVHVTWRFVRSLPSLRRRALAQVIGRTIRMNGAYQQKRGAGFRVIHFSIQPNHVHLIVEASSKQRLAAGMRGLGVWIVRRLNEAVARRGRVLGDRYHANPLASPRQVRAAIVYVLHNDKHHEPSGYDVDEMSSGRWFDGWEYELPDPGVPSPVAKPRTWLASKAWRQWGLVRLDEHPKNERLN